MAESMAERLRRMAAEKKKLAAPSLHPAEPELAAGIPTNLTQVTEVNTNAHSSGTVSCSTSEVPEVSCSTDRADEADAVDAATTNTGTTLSEVSSNCTGGVLSSIGANTSSSCGSTHPLAMEFAELEAMILAADPTMPTILRQIHRHLGQDPELVTMMTEEEVQLMVTGMIVHAKAAIVEPAKAKTAKAAVSAAKKKVITADDL